MVAFIGCSGVLTNQFPYEAAIIRKDLLPQTLRQYKAQASEAEESTISTSGRSEDLLPWWFPPTYDLATEVQFFIKHYRQARVCTCSQRCTLMYAQDHCNIKE